MKRNNFIIFTVIIIILNSVTFALSETNDDEENLLKDIKKIHQRDESFYDLIDKFLNFLYDTQQKTGQYKFENLNYDTDNVFISLHCKFKDLILSGLKTFDYTFHPLKNDKVNLNKYKFNVDLKYENLKIIGEYDLDLNIMTMIPIYGNGNLGLELDTLNLNITVEITDNGVKPIDVNINLDYSLDKLMLSATGLLDTEAQSQLISNVLTDIGAEVLMKLKSKILLMANLLVNMDLKTVVNKNKLTLNKLEEIIKQIIS